jgi:hypothetical protein
MRNISAVMMLALAFWFGACQKQQTEEERRAEVERQVQERLAAERQQQQAQDLAQREASVRAREQALNERTPEPISTPEPPVANEQTSERAPTSSYSTFYTKLEPYGDWIETDDYGYVYCPREAQNNRWRPYTNGRWVYTEAGWTWVSEEPFGWATYHYGRWTRLRGTGWVWVPGNEWAPAWVSWRKGGQYVGWAPLPPEAQFDRASGIHTWSDNYYDIGPDQYVFVPTSEIGEQRVERVIVPAQQNVTILNQTTNITNITYNNTVIVNQGPNYDELRGQSRTPIQRLRLQQETAVPAENVHAIVRGETVTMSAPVISPARAPERPRAIKQTIKQASVDRGWSAISNQREAEQARAKMKSEATPPPNAPSKKFVKPATAPVATAPSATTAPKTTPPTSNVPVGHRTAPATTSAPPIATPALTTVPSPSQSPTSPVTPIPTVHPRLTPLSTSAPSAPASHSPTPANTAPHSSATAAPPKARHGPPPHVSPSVPFSPAPESTGQPASPSPTATGTPFTNAQRRGEKKRQLPRRERPAQASPSPSPQ